MPNNTFTLSKSRYIRGLQCHKSLWLYTYEKDLREESDAMKAIFKQGENVGEVARDIFPCGVLIPFPGVEFDDQIRMTQKALKTAKVIYEATFSYGGVLVKADIMRKVGRSWELYEVKASNGVKDVYLDDIAVQFYVISGSGVKVSKAFVTHLNNEYVRKGELDVQALFTSVDVTAEIKAKQAEIITEIEKQQKMLAVKKCLRQISARTGPNHIPVTLRNTAGSIYLKILFSIWPATE